MQNQKVSHRSNQSSNIVGVQLRSTCNILIAYMKKRQYTYAGLCYSINN